MKTTKEIPSTHHEERALLNQKGLQDQDELFLLNTEGIYNDKRKQQAKEEDSRDVTLLYSPLEMMLPGRPQEDYRKTTGRPREDYRKTTGRPREDHRKTTGRPQEDHRKTTGRPREDHRKTKKNHGDPDDVYTVQVHMKQKGIKQLLIN